MFSSIFATSVRFAIFFFFFALRCLRRFNFVVVSESIEALDVFGGELLKIVSADDVLLARDAETFERFELASFRESLLEQLRNAKR
jgi:hypothetical protein